MAALFSGEPGPLPEVRPHTGTWTVTSADAARPTPPRVRHAAGYEPFVELAGRYGTDARSLFDLWAFAHFLRAHRDAFDEDPELLVSATAFLGNVLIANHPECFWSGAGPELAVTSEQEIVHDEQGIRLEPPHQRQLRVGMTVPAILSADEARFLEFQRTVDDWRVGAPWPPARLLPVRDRADDHD